ncbi:tRNA lysidine(34) synthetase TilS [Paenibacillus elgii]|uniref:tRNA lysidine(34) synthetase TilS n=1 Tax=Paenibacillus elgii TaxID=189691 RepID=UPI002D7B0CED|nr:tRNA lysidine(34) synthetase TilS [Paenibacillus elgii]
METAETLSVQVERFIQDEALIEPGDGVVVAVSGGPDSVGLLHLLFALSGRYRLRLTVAHVNHGFRGAEADREAEMVKSLAGRWGLPVETTFIDMPRIIEETGRNSQAAARDKRYEFLFDVARRTGSRRIALAHHADDQAETLLMRLLRGTGPSGLSGIPVRRMAENGLELIRPLLRIYKADIIRYCEAEGLPYCTDSSNLERKYVRNQVRMDVLPFLSRYNEQLPAALNRLAETMAGEDDFMDREVQRICEQHVTRKNACYSFSAKWFTGVHVALQRRLIKLILNYLASDPDSMDFLKVEQFRTAVLRERPSNFRLEIGQNIALSREYDRIAVHTMVLRPLPYAYILREGQTELAIPETGVRLTLRSLDSEEGRPECTDAWTACFDAEELAMPLTVRSRLPGDRMKPLGLNGTKKVKDMFIDAKVPPTLRETIPILADAGGSVLWVPGVRRSSAAAITGRTKRMLHIQVDIHGKDFY